jgi:sulfate adenylyltransferase subunit 1 (EFTu-like GTPase family)
MIIKVMQVTEKINHWGKQIEVIKPALFVDTLKSSRRQSELAKKEDKDCVVRAFMGALDISYDQAHAWVKKNMNRQDRKGTYTYKAIQLVEGKVKNGYKIGFMGLNPAKSYMKNVIGSNKVLTNPKYKKQTGYTLKSFMENNPVGRFVLIVQGHAVAVVNGVLHANTNENAIGLYRSVWFGFEMK